MKKQFEIVFEKSKAVVTADLLWRQAPITCHNFWRSLARPYRTLLHQGTECGTELWCYVPEPAEKIPYENSEVLPEHGDVLYYHFIQPPTRRGKEVFDIGIYWDRGASKIKQGWIAGNRFAKVRGASRINILRREAGRLLLEGDAYVVLRRKSKRVSKRV